jgi:integrase/recombinase XerD
MVFNPWRITRKMFLSDSEVGALLTRLAERVAQAPAADAGSILDQLIIHSLLFSGLRNSEFCQLKLADTILGRGESVFEVRGTPREERTVYVPQALSEMVRHYARHVRPQLLKSASPADNLSGPLIVNDRGRPYERTGLYRRVVRILTDIGFGSRATVQLLRHTYGYLAYKRSGGNLLFVQRQMGHAHPQVTSVYAEFVDEHYNELADRVGGEASSAESQIPPPAEATQPAPARRRRPRTAPASSRKQQHKRGKSSPQE